MRILNGWGAGKVSLNIETGRSEEDSISYNTGEMGVIRGEIALIPVGPLPLAIGVVKALVISSPTIQGPALLPIAI